MGPEVWYTKAGAKTHIRFPEKADPFAVLERVRSNLYPGVKTIRMEEPPKEKPKEETPPEEPKPFPEQRQEVVDEDVVEQAGTVQDLFG